MRILRLCQKSNQKVLTEIMTLEKSIKCIDNIRPIQKRNLVLLLDKIEMGVRQHSMEENSFYESQ